MESGMLEEDLHWMKNFGGYRRWVRVIDALGMDVCVTQGPRAAPGNKNIQQQILERLQGVYSTDPGTSSPGSNSASQLFPAG